MCVKAFVGNEPFAVLFGVDIVDNESNPAIIQLCKFYEKAELGTIDVQKVGFFDLDKYSIIKTKDKMGKNVCEIEDMVEKPHPQLAPSNYAVLGRHILTLKIFELFENLEAVVGREIQLTDAIKRLIEFEKVYAYEFRGKRYDVGSKIGYLEAIVDFALKREDLE